MFPKLHPTVLSNLNSLVSVNEVHATLFDMKPWKETSPNGFHARFFSKILKSFECSNCLGSWPSSLRTSFGTLLNSTLISLIPKKANPEIIADFRIISLCSVIYKDCY